MENTPVIDRSNFKEMRNKYSISLRDIHKACGISMDTICRFERNDTSYTNAYNVRSYNAKVLIKTLSELISKRASGDLDCENIQSTVQENNKIIYINLREYCIRNNISFKEFCTMCDIDITTLSSKYIGSAAINKVCAATGWTRKDIISGEIFDKTFIEKEANMSYVGTEKSMRALGLLNEEKKEEQINDVKPAAVDCNNNVRFRRVTTPTDERRNVQYVAKNGHYFCQYEVVKQVSDIITREEFMAAINNMEG